MEASETAVNPEGLDPRERLRVRIIAALRTHQFALVPPYIDGFQREKARCLHGWRGAAHTKMLYVCERRHEIETDWCGEVIAEVDAEARTQGFRRRIFASHSQGQILELRDEHERYAAAAWREICLEKRPPLLLDVYGEWRFVDDCREVGQVCRV